MDQKLLERETPLHPDEMEHYLMFPDHYCKGCEGGYGPLCINCLNDDEMVERFFPGGE